MKRFPVVYLRKAQRDLVEIAKYIEKDSPDQAKAWVDKIDHSLGRLEHYPKSGVVPKDGRLARIGYRMVVVGEYLVFYIFRRNKVEIRRILHGRQRYSFLL